MYSVQHGLADEHVSNSVVLVGIFQNNKAIKQSGIYCIISNANGRAKIHSQVTKNKNGIPNPRHVSTNQPIKRCTIRRQKKQRRRIHSLDRKRKEKENIPPSSLVHRGQDRRRKATDSIRRTQNSAASCPKSQGETSHLAFTHACFSLRSDLFSNNHTDQSPV